MTIIEAWDKLKEYHTKIGAADQAAKSAYQDTELFLRLIRSLPVDYQGVIDALDIHVSLTIEDKIKYLRAKELRLHNVSEQAHIARGPKYNRLHHRSSQSSLDQFNRDSRNKYSSDVCDMEDHFVCNCPDLNRPAKLLQSYKGNQGNLKKRTRSKRTPTNHSSDCKLEQANNKHARSRKR
jgi:hypothetical protein